MIIFFNGQSIKNHSILAKFIFQFNFPLFAKCSRKRNQDLFGAGVKDIVQHQTSLNGFAKANFISQNYSSGFQRLDGSNKSIDLMRIKVNVGIQQTLIGRFFQRNLLIAAVLFKQKVTLHDFLPGVIPLPRLWQSPSP